MSAQSSFAMRRARLRQLVASGATTVAPGATDALSARLIEAHGFECVYIGSYATAASRFGLPDTGLLSLSDMVEQVRTIANAVRAPVIADAEGGLNDAPNIWRTVQAFEQAGASAIHIEDHAFGKHADVPQRLRPLEEAVARIHAAVEAREDPDFMVVARSDAVWVSGDFEDAVRRLAGYAEAGGHGVPHVGNTRAADRDPSQGTEACNDCGHARPNACRRDARRCFHRALLRPFSARAVRRARSRA